MNTVEVRPKPKVRERDLVRKVDGLHFPTPLGHQWLHLWLAETQIKNRHGTAFSPSILEAIQGKRSKLAAELPGGDDDKIKKHAFSILERNGFAPWQINHLPPSGDIFRPTNR